MKKFLAATTFIIALAFIIFPALAQNPELTPSTNQVVIYNIEPGNTQNIDVTVKNTDQSPHTFLISVVPSFWNYISSLVSPSLITVYPGQTQLVTVLFSAAPSASFGNNVITISAVDSQNPQINGTASVFVSVIRKSPVYIVGLATDKTAYKPGETATISTQVTNVEQGNTEQFALQVIVTSNNQVLQQNSTIIQAMPVGTSYYYNTTFTIPSDTLPGTYNVQALLKDSLGFTVSTQSKSLIISQISAEKKTTTFGIGFLTTTTTITDTNTGNIPTFLVINVTVPAIATSIFVPQIPPTSTVNYVGGTVYTWVSPTQVNPGNSYSISYSYVVWQIWLVFILLAAVVYFAFQFVFTPTISKSHTHTGPLTKDKEVSISLDVTNRSAHEVKDLVVRDFVPAAVKVVPRFGTVRPQVRESSSGTELLWKFDSLKPGEERVLTYRVKPTVDIMGSLQLPQAQLQYSDRKKQKKVTASREIFVHSQR